MPDSLDLAGQTFGRLTVIEAAPRNARGQTRWLCRCECGTEKIVPTARLRSGGTSSCGCLRRDNMREVARRGRRSQLRSHDPAWRARLRGASGEGVGGPINHDSARWAALRSKMIRDKAEDELAALIHVRRGGPPT